MSLILGKYGISLAGFTIAKTQVLPLDLSKILFMQSIIWDEFLTAHLWFPLFALVRI